MASGISKPFSRIERLAKIKAQYEKWLLQPGRMFGENTWAKINDIELLLEARPQLKRGTRGAWLGWSEVMAGPKEARQEFRRKPIKAGSRGALGRPVRDFRPPDGNVPGDD